MTEIKIGSYKKIDLFYDSGRREFSAQEGDTVIARADSQEKLEKKIDHYLKTQLSQDRIRCYKTSWGGTHDIWLITSYDPTSGEVWISRENKKVSSFGNREKAGLKNGSLFRVNELNQKLVEDIAQLTKQIGGLTSQREALSKQFTEPITAKDLEKE